ncbi:MAG: phosphatidate cytidylyltransferase [Bacillota bacterium]
MLWLRVVSALIGIPILIAIINMGGIWLSFASLALILVGTYELRGMLINKGFKPLLIPVLLSQAIFIFGLYKDWESPFALAIGSCFIITLLAFLYYFPQISICDLGLNFFILIYIGWSLGHLILLRELAQGNIILIYLFIVIWSTDTGAYFGGRFFGKRKLSPQISPNKTIEGAIGGLLFSILVGVVFNRLFSLFPLDFMIITTVILSVCGQLGDLIESGIKRQTGVKDSGNIIPGHGGVLDRFDSTILAVPVLFYLIVFFS